MDLGSLLFILGILILVILVISQPFFNHKALPVIGEDSKISPLLAEQDRIINILAELDFDHHVGKIDDENYHSQRNQLIAQGLQVLQQLESLKAGNISKNIAAIRKSHPNLDNSNPAQETFTRKRGRKWVLTTPDDDLEILLAARRRERSEKAGGFCPQCGTPVQLSDRFCPRCGESLSLKGNE
ncbi:MAG: zinc-ribbon domain-containing protein [Chloroflexi bacterium]|nr:zinc-ribbon domain-containing protein [Chloroflexota bacterium]